MLLTRRLVVLSLVLATPTPTFAQTGATMGEVVNLARLGESR